MLSQRGEPVLVRRILERVDVDKSNTNGDNVLAAADLRPAERRLLLCCQAVDGGDR